MAGQELETEGAIRGDVDPGASIAFRAAVVAATRANDDATRRAALRDAAGAAIALAVSGAESELRSLLTPDPVNANVTWSVACYQIGDLTPSAVRDFADAADAVSTVSQCNDIGHVAAELVASTSMGIRWVALVRTNTTTQLRLPDADATSDSTGRHASELGDAQRRWRRRIAAWAEGTDSGIDLSDDGGDDPMAFAPTPTPPPSARTGGRSSAGPSRATGARRPEEGGVASLREQLAAIERQLTHLDSSLANNIGQDEERAGRLHSVLAEVEARLVDASLDTRSGLANVEHRLGERMASVRDTLVRGLDASSTSAADTRDLVDARTSGLADALRAGVQRLAQQLTANEARLTELTSGLAEVLQRLDHLDQQAQANPEQVRAAVRTDLTELSDHVDAGHAVLDRRRGRDHEALLAVVEGLREGAIDDVRTAIAANTIAVDATAARLVAAVDELGAGTREELERLRADGSSNAEVLLTAIDQATTDTATAAEVILTAIDEQVAASGTAADRLTAAIGDATAGTSTAAERILAAITGQATGSAATAAQILAAVEQASAGTATSAEQILAAVDHVATGTTTTAARILAALAEQREAAADGARQAQAAAQQLSLDLADVSRHTAADASERHRRLALALEEIRRELAGDVAATRSAIDGSVDEAAGRVVREVAQQLQRATADSSADLADAVVALRDEQQRERRAEERQRAAGADAAQRALLAAVQRMHERLDELEASQEALRQSLVGP